MVLRPWTWLRERRRAASRYALERCETSRGVFYVPKLETDKIAHAIRQGQLFEEDVVRAAAQYVSPGSCVLDLGANFGQMTVAFARLVGDAGTVIAVEAEEFVFSVLQKNVEANGLSNVTTVCAAAYDEDGRTVVYPVPDFKRFGTFGSYGVDPNAKTGRTVRTITVDALGIGQPISFMKVDLQGSDLLALRGARDTIRRNRMPIIFEYEEQFQDAFRTSFEEYLEFIDAIGYRIESVVYDVNYLIVPR